MRCSPENIEMQLKLLISMLCSIDERVKANREITPSPRDDPRRELAQRNSGKRSMDMRVEIDNYGVKGPSATEAGSMHSAKLDQFT